MQSDIKINSIELLSFPKSRIKISNIEDLNNYLNAVLDKELVIKKSNNLFLVKLLNASERKKQSITNIPFNLNGQITVANSCAIESRKLQKLSSFINEHKEFVTKGSYTDFNTLHEAYDNITNTSEINSADKETISSAMNFLEEIKSIFLHQDAVNDFNEDMGFDHPY